jgi:mRNA-degrading endonuclease RelE of RelBE toxin-antitoxin system
MSITVEQILTTLHSLDHEEVRKVNTAAYEILKRTRSAANHEAKKNLYVGQTVSFIDKGGYRITGTIKKVNRTKCVVDTGEYRKWTVPMTMLTAK